jgi:chaperonin GroEL
MEYNLPSNIVKDLTFGDEAKNKIFDGVDKLYQAVKSTLGASGKTVIYEDAMGKPVITKDGVTVAESVVLLDPVENMGATLIKQAAQNTVREAGDGTTTATVLAYALLSEVYSYKGEDDIRSLKAGIDSAHQKVIKYIDKVKIDVNENLINSVASISTNNDQELGSIIGKAFNTVGKNGVVLFEDSETNETYLDVIEGAQFECGLKSIHLITDKDKGQAVLDNPYVLIMGSPIPNIRKIQNVLEFVIKNNRSLLIVGSVEQQPMSALLANKVKGNIKVNIIDAPGFGKTKPDTLEDLAIMTGGRVINEELGDDIDLISPEDLGQVQKAITDDKKTVLTLNEKTEKLTERIDHVKKLIDNERDNGFIKKKLEERLALLTGKVAVVYVGANSQVELKEKRDRVEDAIHATKAALQEGIVAGGGVTLLNAAQVIKPANDGEQLLLNAIKVPYSVILMNGDLFYNVVNNVIEKKGYGVDAITGEVVNMVKKGIIDPALVTKTALKNAISVSKTIISSDCVISNIRA